MAQNVLRQGGFELRVLVGEISEFNQGEKRGGCLAGMIRMAYDVIMRGIIISLKLLISYKRPKTKKKKSGG